MIYLLLFVTFFKIGLFGFGGGYAMLSMIQGEVVEQYHWLTTAQFTDIVAISQMTPGPVGINSATYVGYRAVVAAGYGPAMGILGSALATFGVVLPSFLLMFSVTRLLIKYKGSDVVETLFSVLRPAVVGLIAAAALLLMTAENFSTPMACPWQFGVSVFLFVATFVGIKWGGMGIIPMICCCALAGWLLY